MPLDTVESAAHARETVQNLPLEDQDRIKRKIGSGVRRAAKRRRAKQRAVELIREAVPDLEAGVRAIVVILESDDDNE